VSLFALREEHCLRVFENMMLRIFGSRGDEMIGGGGGVDKNAKL
jgi:hypothetical protein